VGEGTGGKGSRVQGSGFRWERGQVGKEEGFRVQDGKCMEEHLCMPEP
jgi:hypothetical protein